SGDACRACANDADSHGCLVLRERNSQEFRYVQVLLRKLGIRIEQKQRVVPDLLKMRRNETIRMATILPKQRATEVIRWLGWISGAARSPCAPFTSISDQNWHGR